MIGDATLVDDRALLEHYARTHDREAFAELTRRYARLVYGTCLRVTGNPADAEDVSQECFLELARRAGTINSSVAGWLHKVAKTRSINVIRRDSARRNREQRAFAEEPADSGSDWAEIAPYVDEAVEKLPDNLRLPTVLHYFHGLEQTHIASQLRVSQSTVSRQLDKAVVTLRKELQNAGVVTVLAGLALLLSENGSSAAPASLMDALGRMALPGRMAASSAAGVSGHAHIAMHRIFGTLPGKLAVGALVVLVAGSVGYKIRNADTTGAAILPAAPAARSAPPATLASATVPAAQASVTPMETYRGDPFLPSNYKKPATDNRKVNGSIPDLPMPRFKRTGTGGDPPTPKFQPVQPARRMAGLVLNNGVSAILETNGETQVVQPGDALNDQLAIVDRIERDRVVLKTTGDNPEFVTIGLAPSPNIAKPTPAPAAAFRPSVRSVAPRPAVAGGVPMMRRAMPAARRVMRPGG